MMTSTTGFLGNNDPNGARGIEGLYALLSDVEQRLQLVKATLAQQPNQGSFPNGFSNAYPNAFPSWGHGQGLGIPQQGFHAFVPTPNGLVPVFIPQSTLVPGSPSNFRL
jgi:hypothetical protein